MKIKVKSKVNVSRVVKVNMLLEKQADCEPFYTSGQRCQSRSSRGRPWLYSM